MRIRPILFLVALAATATSLHAQRRLNLDFEEARTGHPGLPWGWYENASGRSDAVFLDSSMRYSGKSSLRLRRMPGVTGGTATRFSFDSLPDEARRSRVRFAARVFADSLIQGNVALRIVQYDKDGRVLQHDTVGIGHTADGQWHAVAAETVLDSATATLDLVIGMPGAGTAWVDDGELVFGNERVLSDPVWNAPLPESVKSWLRTAEHPLSGVDPGSDTRDLAPLGQMLRGARIIAIGESTHGTSEFRRMDTRITEFAATELGVTLFALEESPVRAEPLNRYLLTGQGDPLAILRPFYNVWQTPELLALVEWMRRYNATGRGRIEFAGIDVIDAQPTIDSVVSPGFTPV